MRIGNYNLMSKWDNMNNLVKIMTKDKDFMRAMSNMPVQRPIMQQSQKHGSIVTSAKNYIKTIFGKKIRG